MTRFQLEYTIESIKRMITASQFVLTVFSSSFFSILHVVMLQMLTQRSFTSIGTSYLSDSCSSAVYYMPVFFLSVSHVWIESIVGREKKWSTVPALLVYVILGPAEIAFTTHTETLRSLRIA